MTQKRHLGDCDQPCKRVRRAYSQFPLNLFRIGPSIHSRETSFNSVELQANCASCSSQVNSGNIKCNFCERLTCSECQLLCLHCTQLYCGFCAVKTYTSANNSGKCLTCS